MGNSCRKSEPLSSTSNSFTLVNAVNGKYPGRRKSSTSKTKAEAEINANVQVTPAAVATGNSLYDSLYDERASPLVNTKQLTKGMNGSQQVLNSGERSDSYRLRQEDISGNQTKTDSTEGSMSSKQSYEVGTQDVTIHEKVHKTVSGNIKLEHQLLRGHMRTGSGSNIKVEQLKSGHSRRGSNASCDLSKDAQKKIHADVIRNGAWTVEPKIQRTDSGRSQSSDKGRTPTITYEPVTPPRNESRHADVVLHNNLLNIGVTPNSNQIMRNDSARNNLNQKGVPLLERRHNVMERLDIGECVDPDDMPTVERMRQIRDNVNIETLEQFACIIKWKKGNLLGRGTFGKVYSALTETGQIVAVKQIQLDTNNWEQAEHDYRLIQREVELLKTLKHPNIVEFLDCGLDVSDYTINILMEHISGGTVASLLKKFGVLEESVFQRYTSQLLDAVTYLHSNNVIHRDIKGSNIMIMTSGFIKLIDFGTAKKTTEDLVTPLSALKMDFCIKGTPYWMAPEVVQMAGEPTCKADVWSIGCTVIEMATGAPPYFHMQPMSALFAIGSMEKPSPRLPDQFSDKAIDFVTQCLTKSMHHRPTAHQLVKHEFVLPQFIHSYPDNRAFFI